MKTKTWFRDKQTREFYEGLLECEVEDERAIKLAKMFDIARLVSCFFDTVDKKMSDYFEMEATKAICEWSDEYGKKGGE